MAFTSILTMKVTILILVDGFLQCNLRDFNLKSNDSHNPYFSRWFSAISVSAWQPIKGDSHNPYFSRWFSAIH